MTWPRDSGGRHLSYQRTFAALGQLGSLGAAPQAAVPEMYNIITQTY